MSVTTTTPRTRVRYPAQRAKDLRIAVTIEEPSTPFSIVVYFVHVIDDENPDAWALIPVGIELGQRFDRPDDGQPHKTTYIGERLPRPLDRDAVQEVTARFREYVEYARGCIAIGGIPNPSRKTPGSRPRRRRRELTDDFLERIAKQFKTWSDDGGRAVTEIANAHGVNRSTASRWVQAARDGGYLPPLETESLGHSGRGRRASQNREAVSARRAR
jgi:transposase-like protein